MKISYRLMEITDYEKVFELWSHTTGMGLSNADIREKINVYLERNRGSCFVAFEKSEIIGTVLCGNDGRRGYIYHLVVKDNYRNQGIGSRLLKKCTASLKKSGIEKCHLFVYQDNSTAIKYYHDKGWQQRNELIIFSKDL
jgi:ribosomal protein S18 acetylase RimI-like enzyme